MSKPFHNLHLWAILNPFVINFNLPLFNYNILFARTIHAALLKHKKPCHRFILHIKKVRHAGEGAKIKQILEYTCRCARDGGTGGQQGGIFNSVPMLMVFRTAILPLPLAVVAAARDGSQPMEKFVTFLFSTKPSNPRPNERPTRERRGIFPSATECTRILCPPGGTEAFVLGRCWVGLVDFFVVVLAFDMLSVCEKSFCQGQEAFGGKTKRCGKFGCAFLFPELSQI